MTQSLDRIGQVVVYKSGLAQNNAMLVDRIGQVAVYKSALARNNAMLVDRIGMVAVYRGPTPAIAASTNTATVRALSELVQALRPASDAAVGSWTNQAGATTSLYVSVAKYSGVDDTTYITATPAAVNDTVKFKLEVPAFEVGDEGYVDYRIAKYPANASQKVNITVNFLQGASAIASWTHTDVSGTLTDITQTLTVPQVALITDYTNLYLEIISQPQ